MTEARSIQTYGDDFSFLKLCLDFLNQELDNIGDLNDYDNRCTLGYFSHLQNGCKSKLILPHGARIVQQLREGGQASGSVLYFVGFIGNQWNGVDESGLKDLWEMDDCLLSQLRDHEDIMAVISGERTPGGNWGNLVIFRDTKAVEKWRNAKFHDKAVRDISPQIYTSIRIHRGALPLGLASDRFRVERTLFLNYDNVARTVQRRHVEMWQSTLKDTPTSPCYA
ncbi:uncharacterized protein [Haliotis cracherodii]|uniref:uncharacterized protein n=1 Tax=Haliotis cracherodii TaxID=6455 RepID=UPI0039EA93B5